MKKESGEQETMFALGMSTIAQGIHNSYRFAGAIANGNQARLAMMNQSGPNMSPAQLSQMARQEAQIEVNTELAKVMFAANQAITEEAKKRLAEDLKAQERSNRIWYA